MIQLGCTKPPLVALHCQQHCVQHTIFCHTSKSILDTQRFRRLLCIQPCVWEETLEKVFRTKQPTLHAISALFPLSHVVLKVVAFLGVRHFDWGHLHVNAPSDPDGHSGIGGVFWMPMDDVLFLPCARHKCPEATGSNRPFVCRYSCDKGRG